MHCACQCASGTLQRWASQGGSATPLTPSPVTWGSGSSAACSTVKSWYALVHTHPVRNMRGSNQVSLPNIFPSPVCNPRGSDQPSLPNNSASCVQYERACPDNKEGGLENIFTQVRVQYRPHRCGDSAEIYASRCRAKGAEYS